MTQGARAIAPLGQIISIMLTRLLSVLLAFTILVLSSSAAVRPTVDVPYVDTAAHPIQIDGATTDWTSEVLSGGLHFYPGDGKTGTSSVYGTTVLGTMSGKADGEMTLYICHDGSSLYVAAIIRDNLLEQRPSANNTNEAWKEDALHIYIDSTNAARANIPNPPISNQVGYEQFGVSTDYNCYTENGDFTTNNGTPGAAKVGAQPDQVHWLVSIHISGTGPYTYVFEERMPLNEVSGHNLRTMTPGNPYGFNAEFVDSDAGVYAQGWFFWSGNGVLDVWNYENMWGIMNLEGIPSEVGNWVLY